MDELKEKLVEFEKYCKNCQFKDKNEGDEPCFECLNEPVNWGSHKPKCWKLMEK